MTNFVSFKMFVKFHRATDILRLQSDIANNFGNADMNNVYLSKETKIIREYSNMKCQSNDKSINRLVS